LFWLPPRKAALISALAVAALSAPGRAETFIFHLHNGGAVVGELVNVDEKPRREYVIRTEDGGEITLASTLVKKIARQRPELVEYDAKAPTFPDTVEGQLACARWCSEMRLSEQRKAHLQRVIELDPENRFARSALGYKQHNGTWLTEKEWLEATGMVKYKSRIMTPQDVELHERARNDELAQDKWFKKLEWIRRQLDQDKYQAAEAKDKLLAISDPNAVRAILAAFAKEKQVRVKMYYVEVLGRIATQPALAAIVKYSLEETDEELVVTCFEAIRRHRDWPVVSLYLPALRDPDNDKVQRAAIGLRYLGHRGAVGPLIDALVTTHKYLIIPPGATGPGSITSTFDKRGKTNGGLGGGLGVNNKPRVITRDIKNQEVLATLVRLTGANFEYDERAWKKWFAAQKPNVGGDTRRDDGPAEPAIEAEK
jgi:hypothetical protein